MVFSWDGGDFGTGWVRVFGTYSPELGRAIVPIKMPLLMEDQNVKLWITSEGKMAAYRPQYVYDGGKASDYKGIYTKQP